MVNRHSRPKLKYEKRPQLLGPVAPPAAVFRNHAADCVGPNPPAVPERTTLQHCPCAARQLLLKPGANRHHETALLPVHDFRRYITGSKLLEQVFCGVSSQTKIRRNSRRKLNQVLRQKWRTRLHAVG